MMRVSEYVEGIQNPALKVTTRRIRAMIKRALPDASETIQMGIPNYSINSENIAAIADYTKHVNLYLFSGARLTSKLLQGSGMGMRHISIKNLDEINEKEITRLLKQARNLVKGQKK